MLTFLRRFWSAIRRHRSPILDFEFFDGDKTRRIDSVATLIRLQSLLPGDFHKHPGFRDASDIELVSVTCKAIQRAFDVRRFDPDERRGLTMAEMLQLLTRFLAHVEALEQRAIERGRIA